MDVFFDDDENHGNVVFRLDFRMKTGQVFDNGADDFFRPFGCVIAEVFLYQLHSELVFAKIMGFPDAFGIPKR